MTNNSNFELNIGWLYPDLMSTYGDRGNVITLTKRCQWRNIDAKIIPIDQQSKIEKINEVDLIFGGGAQDRQQEIVMRDLRSEKKSLIKNLIEKNIPALFVCGAPQLMGNFYETADGKKIEGLGIFDVETIQPKDKAPRCIGNIAAKICWENLDSAEKFSKEEYIVGFENHGGRTYLGKNAKPFAKVIKGFGNNGEDKTEGVVYKNAIGSYLHGPLLPKNPHIADLLISTALKVKYNKVESDLKSLDDSLENEARNEMLKRIGIK